MKKEGVNRKERFIEQVDVPTKTLHILLRKASLWLLTPQLFAPVFNFFSAKIVILCIASLLLSFSAIIASKHPSNNYVRNLRIKTGRIKPSETIEALSVVFSLAIIATVTVLYGMALLSNIQL